MRGWIFYLVLLFILVPTVSALGISPSDTYLKFEPYKTGSFEINLINNREEATNATLSVEGPFSEYFTVLGGVKEIGATSSEKYMVGYSFPSTLPLSGPINHDLRIKELVELKEGITASLSVVARVVVEVPYPERYIEYNFNVDSVNEGGDLEFNFDISSKGEGNIFGFKPHVIIYGINGDEVLTEVVGTTSSLLSGMVATKTLVINSSDLGGGTFVADSYVEYDGIETPHKNRTFRVGYEDVNVLEYPHNVSLGGIKKLVFLVGNMWNGGVEDVFLEVYLEKDGVPVTERAISSGISMKALGEDEIPIYLEVSNVVPGDYQLVVVMNYNGLDKTERFDFSVIKPINLWSGGLVTWFLIGILILANILWIYLRGGRDSEDKTKDTTARMDSLQKKLGK